MIFETRIFIPFERKTSDLVLSEKITYSSFGLIFLCFIILFIFHKFSSPELINFLSTSIISLGFIAIFLGGFLRMFEYENLNGTFDGHFQLDSENIKMNNRIFELSTISALKIEILNYKGQRTNNTKSGPSFYQGISNRISFESENEPIKIQFLLLSQEHIDDFYEIIVSIIAKEKINYTRNLINLIPEKHRKSQEFRNFILKLIMEKKLECTEGLLIHGYSSDEEARQLRAKYCY